jgi:hypothetical protein
VVLAVVAATVLVAGACSDDSATGGSATTTTASAAGSSTTSGGSGAAGGGTLHRYAGYTSANYDDPTHWLCRPGRHDICSSDLDATVVAADGTLTPEPFVPAKDPKIDCFYVYPTISRDPGQYSDWNASDDEEGYAAVNQAARLRSVCRLYAPVYRQRTLAGLASALGSASPAAKAGATTTTPPTTTPAEAQPDPYADVLDAWKTYMAEDNRGRGVVLIGHSQGGSILSRLVKEEIDPNPDVRAQLVSAYLVGAAVGVPPGKDVGGDDQHVPLCRTPDQFGCIATWASFRSTAPPPPDSLFGAVRGSSDLVAGCTNPASLAGGSAMLHPYFPADPKASILAALGASTDAGTTSPGWAAGAKITTPFVSLPGLVSGECVDQGGHDVLSITVHPDPGPRIDDIGGDLTPQWGLHLVDLNLTMGDVVSLVRSQSTAWLAAR